MYLLKSWHLLGRYILITWTVKPFIFPLPEAVAYIFSKLVGKWERADNNGAILTYHSNNTGKFELSGTVCSNINFTLTGNILVELYKMTNKCEYYEGGKIISRIEFSGEDELHFFYKNDDGTYDKEAEVWTRIK